MALIRLSGLIGSIEGAIGGTIFQRGTAGTIARARCIPVNPSTPRQVKSRKISFQLQQEWILLTQDQRDLWDGYVQYNPIAQKRSSGRFINGHEAFLKLNHYRLEYDLTILKEPQFLKCDLTPVDADLSLSGINLFLNLDRNTVGTEEFVILFVSIPLPGQWTNPRSFRKLLKFTTGNAQNYNIRTEYEDLFGFSPVSGDTLFFKFTNADKRSGRLFPFKSKKVTL